MHRAILYQDFIQLTVQPAAAPVELVGRGMCLAVDYTYAPADPADVGSVDQFNAKRAALVDNVLLHAADDSMVLMIRAGTDILDKITARQLARIEESLPPP